MKKYVLTPEHEKEFKPWAQKWIDNAMSTKAMDENDYRKNWINRIFYYLFFIFIKDIINMPTIRIKDKKQKSGKPYYSYYEIESSCYLNVSETRETVKEYPDTKFVKSVNMSDENFLNGKLHVGGKWIWMI